MWLDVASVCLVCVTGDSVSGARPGRRDLEEGGRGLYWHCRQKPSGAEGKGVTRLRAVFSPHVASSHCVSPQDYKPEEDPCRYKSVKTGRGPLGPDWKVQYRVHVGCRQNSCQIITVFEYTVFDKDETWFFFFFARICFNFYLDVLKNISIFAYSCFSETFGFCTSFQSLQSPSVFHFPYLKSIWQKLNVQSFFFHPLKSN